MAPINWRRQYDSTRDTTEGNNAAVGDLGLTMTQQHFAKDADLNEIVRRFGVVDALQPYVPIDPKYYGDFTDAPDFRQALDNTRTALELFSLLPADIRNRFQNDPVQLWQFVNDPRNTEESIKIGLLKQEAPAPPPTPP